MKRPIVVITIGNLIGIILWLYFNKSIAFIILLLILVFIIISRFQNKKARYIRLLIKPKIMIGFIISITISTIYVIILNKKYENFYNKTSSITSIVGIIVTNPKEKDYSYNYELKIRDGKHKGKKILLVTNKNQTLGYGDLIKAKVNLEAPEKARNYKGFDYSKYLKSKKIYGIAKSSKIQVIKKNQINKILLFIDSMRLKIIEQANKLLPIRTSGLMSGLLIGDILNIPDDIIESFEKSSLLHILAVSRNAYIVYNFMLYILI